LSKKSKATEALDYLGNLAIFTGVPLFAVLIILLLTDPQNFLKNYASLLSALFILIASGIASASVMKSIEANKELKNKDIAIQKNEKAEKNYARMLLMAHVLITINSNYKRILDFSEKSTKEESDIQILLQYDTVKSYIKSSYDTWEKIYNENYLLLIENKALESFSKLTEHIHFYYEYINKSSIEDKAAVLQLIAMKLPNEMKVIHNSIEEIKKNVINKDKIIVKYPN
jgi:hypothetical protein